MARYLKVLLLTAIASGAFAAVSVSSASAVDVFTCESNPCVITGEQVGTPAQNVWGVKGSVVEVRCSTVIFGPTTMQTGATEISLHPVYTSCIAEPFGSTPIDSSGCNYVFTGTTDSYKNTNSVVESEDATTRLACEGTSTLHITAPGCTIGVGSAGNQNLQGVKYDNVAGGTDSVLVTVTIDNMSYTSSGALCAFSGLASAGTNAFLTRRITLKAYKDNGSTNEGVQTGLTQS